MDQRLGCQHLENCATRTDAACKAGFHVRDSQLDAFALELSRMFRQFFFTERVVERVDERVFRVGVEAGEDLLFHRATFSDVGITAFTDDLDVCFHVYLYFYVLL